MLSPSLPPANCMTTRIVSSLPVTGVKLAPATPSSAAKVRLTKEGTVGAMAPPRMTVRRNLRRVKKGSVMASAQIVFGRSEQDDRCFAHRLVAAGEIARG